MGGFSPTPGRLGYRGWRWNLAGFSALGGPGINVGSQARRRASPCPQLGFEVGLATTAFPRSRDGWSICLASDAQDQFRFIDIFAS